MGYVSNLLDRNPNLQLIDIPYSYTYDIRGKSRTDWSGTQSQRWTSRQRDPQKTLFPYGIKTERVSGYTNERTGKWTQKTRSEDRSGGQWYFEDELIFATPADKYHNNSSMDGWTGGKILMTIYEAQAIGLTPDQILNFYRQDEQFKKIADQVGRTPSLFFEYRKDGSITGIYKPPIVPPPAPVQIPNPLSESFQQLHQQIIDAELNPEIIQSALANPQLLQPAHAEPEVVVADPSGLHPDVKWMVLGVLGVGLLFAIILLRRK